MIKNDRLSYLFLRFYQKTITDGERKEFIALLLEEDNRQDMYELIGRAIQEEPVEHHLNPETADEILASIFSASPVDTTTVDEEIMVPEEKKNAKTIPLVLRWMAAASIGLLLLYAGFYWQRSSVQETEIAMQKKPVPEILPGGNKARLTLSNGEVLDLEMATNGYLPNQSVTEINKSKGEIIYNNSTYKYSNKPVQYNTLTTPRGGQYKVVLPDGSRAWLNAASSLKFPVAFVGKKREVTMSGEVYFEIEPNKNMPFTVRVSDRKANGKDMEITVLGTHFNICSYADEPNIQTTLLEGSVKIKKGEVSRILLPGQQAQVPPGEDLKKISVKTVNTESVVAWKDGRFEFNGNIKGIMNNISRWYGLEVQYEGEVGNKAFAGVISRKANVSEVLKMLELTGGIHFTIEGHRIIVKNVD